MNQFCTPFFSDFERELELLKDSDQDIITQTNKTINWIEGKISTLHKWLKKHKFESEGEEIYFFKVLKPRVKSNLIYHHSILKLESNAPASKKLKIKYYEKALDKINEYAVNNKDFYQYYRSRSCHKDAVYFVRTSKKKIDMDDCYLINYDRKLCTSHDYKLANFIANDLLSVYLENKLYELDNIIVPAHTFHSGITWSANKVDFVELVYALHNLKCINGGDIEIKDLAIQLSKLLNLDIDENSIYRIFNDIKNRKTVKTKFLTSLIENLIYKLEEEEF